MKVGIIGTGNMGGILISSFIESLAVQPSNLMIANRTKQKAEIVKDRYPDILIGDTADAVVQFADVIFLCVKPHEFYDLLQNIKADLTQQQVIISITSPISLKQLESIVSCHVARVIPSITNRALSGASLVTFGEHCGEECKQQIMSLMSCISKPIIIEENITRVSSDIASCGPAFFSFLLQQFIHSAVEVTEISEGTATQLASEMIIGMGKLLEKEIFTLPTLIEKVCVKGGVTGEALKVFREELGPLFDHVIDKTHEKYEDDCEKVSAQFNQKA